MNSATIQRLSASRPAAGLKVHRPAPIDNAVGVSVQAMPQRGRNVLQRASHFLGNSMATWASAGNVMPLD